LGTYNYKGLLVKYKVKSSIEKRHKTSYGFLEDIKMLDEEDKKYNKCNLIEKSNYYSLATIYAKRLVIYNGLFNHW